MYPQLDAADIGCDLSANNLLRFLCFMLLLRCFDELLGSKGDEHADPDDAHFAGEFAPAMQCLVGSTQVMQTHGSPKRYTLARLAASLVVVIGRHTAREAG